jgi:predicted ATPase/DNA-binding winged helix-turn-helix (wHTH) protein
VNPQPDDIHDLADAGARRDAGRFRFGIFTLDCNRRIISRDGIPVSMGSRAFDLLSALVRNAGNTVSKAALFEAAWPGSVVEESNLRVHIAALRRLLNEDLGPAIKNEPGRGYSFVAPTVREPADATRPSALPAHGTGEHLFGREGVIREISALLPLRRFITLTGPGGVGKTSVARAVAAGLAPVYRDGALLLDFSVARQPTDLVHMLASALSIKAAEDEIGDAAFTELASRDLLLVLDNCEHLINDVTSLAENLRSRAPHVHVLATSREAMRAHGEWVYPISILGYPTVPPSTIQQLLQYPATALLVFRLEALGYHPPLRDDDAAELAAIASGLDGLPLAIELAAANAGILSISDLAQRLSERLDLLTIGRRLTDKRHHTLEATIDWSYSLLSPDQARAWRWLGTFAGEFSLVDADTLVAEADIHGTPLSRLFFELVGKSLVDRSVRGGKVAFRLLETMRIFAMRKLAENEEVDDARRAHARMILARLRGTSDRWDRADLLGTELGTHLADVRLALNWALLEGKDVEIDVIMIIESAPVWFRRRQLGELQSYLEAAQEAAATVICSDRQIARLELALAHTRFHQAGVGQPVREGLLHCYAAAARAGDLDATLQALWALFGHASVQGNYPSVAEYAGRYEAALPEGAAQPHKATVLRMRSLAYHLAGHQAPALATASDGLANLSFLAQDRTPRVFQYDHRLATLAHRAKSAWLLGRFDEALDDCDTILETARHIDQPFGLGYALATSACAVAIWHGDLSRAEDYVGTLLDPSSDISNVWRSAGLVYRFALDHLSKRNAGTPPGSVTPFYSDILASISTDLLSSDCWRRATSGPEHWCTAEIHRAHGELRLVSAGLDAAMEAERDFELAVAISRRQGAVAWELRALVSQARLRLQLGKAASLDELRLCVARLSGVSKSADVRRAEEILARA